MQYSKILPTLYLCLIAIYTQAQDNPLVKISGTVKAEDGSVVSFVSVGLKESAYGAVSDENGHYTFSAPPGKSILFVSALGYESQESEVNLQGTHYEYNFLLKETATSLDEVVVHGKTESQTMREMPLQVNAIEIKKIANTTMDLNQALNRTTGVKVREEGGVGSDFDFSINGLSGSAIKFFIDGIPMEVMGSTMTLNNIPVNLAERVEVYKGVVPVALGADALGGAVNVVTNQNINNYLDASYSIGSFNTHRMALSGQTKLQKTGIIIRANSFVNYSDNNYVMRGVEWYDPDQNRFVENDFRRFHDQFFSAFGMLEVGVTDKKWADIFMVSGSYSLQNKDIQTGATQNILYGNVERNGTAYNTGIRYKKDDFFIENLDLNLYASLSANSYEVIDTTYRQYSWDGSYRETNRAEMSNGARSIWHYSRPTNVGRINLNYKLGEAHSFNLNYLINDFRNKVYDDYNTNQPTEDQITKHIAGLAYQQNFLQDKLANTLFVKYYGVALTTKLDTENAYYDPSLVGQIENANGVENNFGYGLASRYKFGDGNFGVKASYEYAYRLQEPDELLGNGTTVMPNFDLKPESSHNYNLGVFWGKRIQQNHNIFIEGSGFYRGMQDYIQGIYREALGITQYQNTSNVTIDGFESEISYSYANLLNLRLNASYQNAINTTITDGKKEITHGYQLPNRPWIFGNADFSIGKDNILGNDTRLEFSWSTQYVHWFYLSWANFGNPDHKSVIPTQYIHNALISYALQNGRYNISVECKNLSNSLAYDNYKLQKPGRAFYAKFRVFIN